MTCCFFLMIRRPPRSTLFPYTTLFRSNIAVCVKHIPDPNLPGELDGVRLKRAGVQGVLDPGDEFGVEAGLQLKESQGGEVDRKSTRLNSSHANISYAVFCLKKNKLRSR